ncbi:hypothetical protein GYMLUDRAFT_249431 [Collybiopsis luxurians FD-317 M1]|uniref:Uncharacterized protein n=1 Tax=Collybiopsis luxurians FD-317 M1 TaxID=944289 RepID=A0A0D0AVI4_9AGAR|nr:hypothetical protein GYMLUDRAFT_249431 [Collybiopsis luxurians FD-317 M1]
MTIPGPQVGSFVVFSLDAVTMVEDFHNPSLTKACRELKMGKYVAYVSQLDQVISSPSSTPHVSAALHFVFQGPPPSKFDWVERIEPDMTIPVLPNASHPLGRPPINPGAALPWKKCSISPLIATWAKVFPTVSGSKLTHMARPEEQRRVLSAIQADVHRWNTMGRGKVPSTPLRSRRPSVRSKLKSDRDAFEIWKEGLPPFSIHTMEISDDGDDSASFYTARSCQSPGDDDLLEYVSSASKNFTFRKLDALRSLAVNVGRHKAEMEPIVKIFSDLSTVNKLCPPQQYFLERDLLQKSLNPPFRGIEISEADETKKLYNSWSSTRDPGELEILDFPKIFSLARAPW